MSAADDMALARGCDGLGVPGSESRRYARPLNLPGFCSGSLHVDRSYCIVVDDQSAMEEPSDSARLLII